MSEFVDFDWGAVDEPGVLELTAQRVVVHGDDQRGGLRGEFAAPRLFITGVTGVTAFTAGIAASLVGSFGLLGDEGDHGISGALLMGAV